jgi:hypothetical protein
MEVPYKTPMASGDALPETSFGAIEKIEAELKKVRKEITDRERYEAKYTQEKDRLNKRLTLKSNRVG